MPRNKSEKQMKAEAEAKAKIQDTMGFYCNPPYDIQWVKADHHWWSGNDENYGRTALAT